MSHKLTLFATCPKGVEDLLAEECEQQGLVSVHTTHGGASGHGELIDAYRLCLWSRVASRVLLQLHTFPITDYEDLYRGVQAVDWGLHVKPDGSFAIDVHSTHQHINNSHYATLKIKDAIADQFRHQFNCRPDVKRDRPDIRINAYIDRQHGTLYLDLSGEALHKRGYRKRTSLAPLKENLAAAILLRAHWPQLAREHRPLIDPLCGSATLLVEAAYMAVNMAPGLLREYYGFLNWVQHQPASWSQLVTEARATVDKRKLPRLIGIEKSFKVVGMARENIETAGFGGMIEIRQADSVQVLADISETAGLIVTNPPYGKRIGENETLKRLYLDLGRALKAGFPGWNIALFTASHELAKFFGLRAHHKNTLYNGPIKCTLYHYRIHSSQSPELQPDVVEKEMAISEEAEMFANRLSKNIKHLSKWARKEGIGCYRVYDADIPHYAVAIDIYQDWVHVQEYAPPKSVDSVKAFVRLDEAVDIISSVLDVSKSRIVVKTRKKQSGKSQYERQDETGESLIVNENGLKFRINLKDYLDTGLFLDHRLTRQLIARLAHHKTFLNLFAYTATASVYAAAAGARSTTTVDMSNTYLAWAQQNMKLNHLLDKKHVFIREDCIKWLDEENNKGKRYQLIFLDPPTFSNSKRMDHTLDIRRDHVELIRQAMAVLADDGLLIFSCNARGFKLDEEALRAYAVRDITRMTTAEDFRRKPAHVCWCLAKNAPRVKDCKL
ncbi:MAG: bifunctional 23S rRNA (guanine(2069)-N(7))-methyltransferase RlmK/23S rRNA (guanine(2445)-N(2))-methyltransferase RlmL [Gammaproteobacteria bacterium]